MPMHVHAFVLNDAEDTLYAAGHDQLAVVEFKAAVNEEQQPDPTAAATSN